jgi:hypothetical protein
MYSFLNFIKYHNGFPILLVVLFLGAGGAFAATQISKQSSVFSTGTSVPTTPTEKIDTTKLLALDFKTYDAHLKITSVTQDSENYFVKYTYQTLAIVETGWETVPKTGTMTVAKKMLGTRDLGLYVAEQLGQIVDQQIAYLKEVQSTEKAKTSGSKQASGGEYASLAGSQLDAKNKTFSGYKPVVTTKGEAKTKGTQAPSADTTVVQTETQTAQTTLSKKEIEAMIVAAVAQFLAIDTSMPDGPGENVVPTELSAPSVPGTDVVPEVTDSESTPPAEIELTP